MGVDDDPAGAGLAEDLGQAHHRHRPRADQVGEHLPGPDRRQLIDVADDRRRPVSGSAFSTDAHQRHVDHRRLVDDQQVALERSPASRSNPPPFGSNSSSRWMVFASSPVVSARRLAARPVGAARSGVTPFARRMVRMPRMMVVLPTPGPPVTIRIFDDRALLTASRWPGGEPHPEPRFDPVDGFHCIDGCPWGSSRLQVPDGHCDRALGMAQMRQEHTRLIIDRVGNHAPAGELVCQGLGEQPALDLEQLLGEGSEARPRANRNRRSSTAWRRA